MPSTHREKPDQGEILKNLRLALALTQGQVAAAAGAPISSYLTVLKVEKGEHKLSRAAARDALARAFRLSRDEFAWLLNGRLSIKGACTVYRARTTAAEAAA